MAKQEGTVAEVAVLPTCDFCTMVDPHSHVEASFDGKTKQGAWANMCTVHYGLYGTGLGVGKGQRLVLAVAPAAESRPLVDCPVHHEQHVLDATRDCFDACVQHIADQADPYAHL